MSMEEGDNIIEPLERGRRRVALGALGLMMVVFIVLSAFSFVTSRDQVLPETITYAADFEAVEGKRVFQAYNCMGCHTIVGNGAYFGPDLTDIYENAGPAWLAAYLPSAASWPTEAALRTQLHSPNQLTETGIDDLEEYLTAYPGARERIYRRGGSGTYMPNLPFTGDEVNNLIAFLKYTSAMNTEGWPPEPQVDGLQHPLAAGSTTFADAGTSAGGVAGGVAGAGAGGDANSSADSGDGSGSGSAGAVDLAAQGAGIAQQFGCLACHASDESAMVGPGWGGLYGTTETLDDGSSADVDEAYLALAIREPDAQVVAGYQAGVMPAYANVLSDDEVDAIVAYIRSLETR